MKTVLLLAFGISVAATGVLAEVLPQEAEGRLLFENRCGLCHAAPGVGYQVLKRRLGEDRAELALRRPNNEHYIKSIARHGIGLMPPFTRVALTDAELESIAAYLTHEINEKRGVK